MTGLEAELEILEDSIKELKETLERKEDRAYELRMQIDRL